MRRHGSSGLALVAVGLCLGLASATAASSRQAVGSLANLLWEYRNGNADEAVRALAGWSQRRVQAEGSALPELSDPWDWAALALLHSEARTHDTFRRELNSRLAGLHGSRADALMDRVLTSVREHTDSSLYRLVRDFSLVLVPGDAWPWMRRRFPDDLDVVLAHGRWLEYWMPRIPVAGPNSYGFMPGPAVMGTSHGRFGQEALEAVGTLGLVVERAPARAEARVRLGRVLWQLDRWDDAERELRLVLSSAAVGPDNDWIYLAGFFLGQLLEERGHYDEARDAYERGWSAVPGQAVALRLIRLSLIRGTDPDVRSWLMNSTRLDPWLTYGQRQNNDETSAAYRALRPRVRVSP